MAFNIRTASPLDNLLISGLGGKTFYETWRPVNTEEDMQMYIKKAFDPDLLKGEIENGKVFTFLIAEEDRDAVGYTKLRRDRTYEEFDDERAIELERIYVLKPWQDKKAGKALMDASIELARREGFRWLWLGVNIDNEKAIRFYKKYGFVIFGEKSFQLGNAVDNDYLMKMKL